MRNLHQVLEWLETCLTTSQPNSNSKEVAGTNIYSFILCANNPFLLLCDPNLYGYCRVVYGHSMLTLGIQGLTLWGNCWVVYMLDSEAGRIMEEIELLGQLQMSS